MNNLEPENIDLKLVLTSSDHDGSIKQSEVNVKLKLDESIDSEIVYTNESEIEFAKIDSIAKIESIAIIDHKGDIKRITTNVEKID